MGWVAKGGGGIFDKMNVVIIESMGWVAKGGKRNFDKRNVKMLIKGM